MGDCVVCDKGTDGLVCENHQQDVAFEFEGNDPSQLIVDRYYRATVDSYSEFGVFVELTSDVTGLLHRSEFDEPPRQSDWELDEDIFVQIDDIQDNGNTDLSMSSRQLEGHFREILVQTPSGDQLRKTSELNRRETEIDSETKRMQNRSVERSISTKYTSGKQTVQFWKVPCPACNQNILNEFSAFKDHWQDNAKCSGPVAVNDSTWKKLGVNPAEIQQTSKPRIDQSSHDVQHDTSNQIDKESLPNNTGFPFFGSDRDQMRVKCPTCNKQIDNTQSSFISHWINSDSCEGPPTSRVPGVSLSLSEWNDLVNRLEEYHRGGSTDSPESIHQKPSESDAQRNGTIEATDKTSSHKNSPRQNTINKSGQQELNSRSVRNTKSEEDGDGTAEKVDESLIDNDSTEQDGVGSSTEESAVAVADRIPNDPEDELPNECLYRDLSIGDLVGEGGFAKVHEARIDDMDERVALKRPKFSGTLPTSILEQFVDEAEMWGKIVDNPHVVNLVDWGQAPEPWIAMEYMNGGDIRDRLDDIDGQLNVAEGLWIATSLAETVSEVHHLGIRHLDLKPRNILFTSMPDGTWDVPKIGDWGVAHLQLDGDANKGALSPRYAAPEQFAGISADLDHHTDIYQLGATIYELLTGRPASEEGIVPSDPDITALPTPPSEVRPDLPASVDGPILTALESAKADRFERVLYFHDELEQVLNEIVNGPVSSLR